jgi:DNA-binding transcriptional LysR family regulator
VGSPLFDHSAYRATLTAVGIALLPDARRIAEAAGSFNAHAASLARGYEAEISLVIDSIFPMQQVHRALHTFSQRFPAIPTRLYVESYGNVARVLLEENCTIGLLNEQSCAAVGVPLTTYPAGIVELVPVVAPAHPLAAAGAPIPIESMRDHIRLVLGDRSSVLSGRDIGKYYGSLWFVSDIAAKRDLLLAGVDWGIMPSHMVEAELDAGRLVRIHPERSDYRTPTESADGQLLVTMYGAHRTGYAPGPAAAWLLEHFAGGAA